MASASRPDPEELAGRMTHLLAELDESGVARVLAELAPLTSEGGLDRPTAERLAGLTRALAARIAAERDAVGRELERIHDLRVILRDRTGAWTVSDPQHLDRSV